MERKFSFSPGEYFHIYNRGVDKREIFSDSKDYIRFTKLLYLCNSNERIDLSEIDKGTEFAHIRGDTLVYIGAWCLMPNHFHLLVRAKDRKGNPSGVSVFMNKLQTGYSMYFNKKYKRSGCLFQGAFKAQHVNSDRYLKYLFAYIHLNPITIVERKWKEKGVCDKEKAKMFLASVFSSSYQDYAGIKRLEGKIIEKNQFPSYFEKDFSFEQYLDVCMNQKFTDNESEGEPFRELSTSFLNFVS